MKKQFFVLINVIKIQVRETGIDYNIDCEKMKCNCNNRRPNRQVHITYFYSNKKGVSAFPGIFKKMKISLYDN